MATQVSAHPGLLSTWSASTRVSSAHSQISVHVDRCISVHVGRVSVHVGQHPPGPAASSGLISLWVSAQLCAQGDIPYPEPLGSLPSPSSLIPRLLWGSLAPDSQLAVVSPLIASGPPHVAEFSGGCPKTQAPTLLPGFAQLLRTPWSSGAP